MNQSKSLSVTVYFSCIAKSVDFFSTPDAEKLELVWQVYPKSEQILPEDLSKVSGYEVGTQ